MYMHAMELVRLGDTSVEVYNRLMDLFKSNLSVMLSYTEIRDGLVRDGLQIEKGAVVNQSNPMIVVREQNHSGQQAMADFGETDSMSRTSNCLDRLLAPAKRKEMGRPTARISI